VFIGEMEKRLVMNHFGRNEEDLEFFKNRIDLLRHSF